MILLIIDTEPKWTEFLQSHFTTTTDPAQPWHIAVISALLMRDVPPEIWQRGAVVATSNLSAGEGIDAYRLGALMYFTKDFTPARVRGLLEGVPVGEGER